MGLLDRIDSQKKPNINNAPEEVITVRPEVEEIKEDPYLDVKRRIHSAIIDEMKDRKSTRLNSSHA